MKIRAKINQLTESEEKMESVEETKRRNITAISKEEPQWPSPRPLGIKEFTRKDLYG